MYARSDFFRSEINYSSEECLSMMLNKSDQ